MPIEISRYVKVVLSNLDAIESTWDDYDPYKVIPRNDPNTEQLLSDVSDRAKYVFSLGCAEWVHQNIASVVELDNRPQEYLDALWLYAISDKYLLPPELDYREWVGFNYGPVCLALTTVLNTAYGFDERNSEIDAAFAEKVAQYVLSASGQFLSWKVKVIDRMREKYPFHVSDPLGERVAHDILDPSVGLDGISETNILWVAELENRAGRFQRIKKKPNLAN